jgi:tetratricopeptide (TPR) repeat protein
MKKFLAVILFAVSSLAFAEASFDEIQSLINSKNYAAAASGLEGIIQNHPKSAKAFYAMAEAQAGLGNLDKAQKALNIAKGIDPTLKFVSEGSVRSLEQAITPQTAKITYEEPSHFWRNFAYFALACGFGWACYFFWGVYNRKKDEDDAARVAKEAQWAKEMDEAQERHNKFMAEKAAQAQAQAQATATPQAKKTKKQLKDEADALALREATARAEAAEADARRARMNYSTTPAPTVVNNSSSNDMLTGVLIGNMLSGSHHSHDTERTVVRETVREVPASTSSSRNSSWDDDSSSSSSSKRSSSWDDDSSSSSSSSSWSSSSDSSSSWDSGSSSSSSSWD